MDYPLTRWYCDVCGDAVESVRDGYVTWQTTEKGRGYGYKIIHVGRCDKDEDPSSSALEDFLGDRGLSYLLAQLSFGPLKLKGAKTSYTRVENLDEFVDFFRRVQTPYYEEARRKFSDPEVIEDFSDSNEVAPYLPENLAAMVKPPKV